MFEGSDGPIVYIDDDEEDHFLFQQMLKELAIPNDFFPFTSCQSAIDFLETTPRKPFMILCDLNLPDMSGLEFRQRIDQTPHLKQKSIPFLFLSTVASPQQVQQAYQSTVQGFLLKPYDYDQLKENFQVIIAYWKLNLHP